MTETSPQTLPEGFSPPGTVQSPITVLQPASWSDLDAYGHVNHAVYLTWFENARFTYFEHVDLSRTYVESKIGPILREIKVDYLAPVGFPEFLWVTAWVSKIGNSSMTMHHRVWSKQQDREVAKATGTIITVDYSQGAAGARPTRVPDSVRAAIVALDGAET